MSIVDSWWNNLPSPEQNRPWGEYEILLDEKNVKVKRIRVKPNKRLSYQYHNKRREQWIVVQGNLTIILDDEKVFRSPGESSHITLGAKHRAWNETQDDIVRLEDDFDRV